MPIQWTPFPFPQPDREEVIVLVPSRPMVPEKYRALYGYGSVSWKDRMEDWKKRQSEKLQMVKLLGNNDSEDFDGSELDPDMPT
ncbi:cellulose synthase A catalytic subunit 6 [UDP-forming]-like [Henckelia pumila]|uniref:cellulose synthase A catalytic subunit 6 [UDP-forming]-like n=1 Tax=Henckelia pumila TaxID=405737 RepID=UPI003C6E78E8